MPIPARVAQWNKVGLIRVRQIRERWFAARWEAATVVPEDRKRAAHRALKDRILDGEGTTPRDLRARAFENAGLPAPLDALLGKVATTPTDVTEADFAAAQAAGFSEDQLFELVVCAAVGQSTRLYEAGLDALARAAGFGEDG